MFTSLSASVRRLYNSFTKFSLSIGIGLSILFFSLNTTLHFLQYNSLAEFFLTIITFIPISSLSQYITKDLVIRLQRNDYELLAGILNRFFGNITELYFILIAIVKREPVITQTALTGSLISSYLIIFDTSLLFGSFRYTRQYYPAIITRVNTQVLVISLVSITIPIAFRNWSEGNESGLLTVSRDSAIILLAEFWLRVFYRYPCHIVLYRKIDYSKNSQSYSIYTEITILIFLTVTLAFISVYLLAAIYTPSEKLQLSETFIGLIIILSILVTINHIVTIICSREEGIAWVIEIAFSSSIRISLFVFPLTIIFG
ncbi:hypothetical protein NA56DRAFT_572129 [Hyaloscypha hepaticicola]|uniref:Sodium/calcium exchanger membrane region domain-containing protein n=1 Tax=Hyaloscypha hepaticicola TaxID=2082293 RepID=A0A2J6Q4Y8_9HELO|nr:hypothetical protein NA56DRAFT_572129 [Hyaloscypha hepaticicola]